MPKVRPEEAVVQSTPGLAAKFLGALGPFEGRNLSQPYGLRHLGANLETLPPGSSSSHRHWHEKVDEIVVVLEGSLTLFQDGGPVPLSAGDVAVFPAGDADGHCLRNEGAEAATFLVVASHDSTDRCHYVEVDAVAEPDGTLRRADGTLISPPEGPA